MRTSVAGLGNTFAFTGAPGTSPLPIFQAYFAGTPLSNTASNGNPANYTHANYRSSNWFNNLGMYSNSMTGDCGHGHQRPAERDRDGHQPGREPDRRRAAHQLLHREPVAGAGQFEPADERRQHAVSGAADRAAAPDEPGPPGVGQLHPGVRLEDLDVADAAGRLDSGSTARTARTRPLKFNWVYELPFGQGKKWGSGVGKGMNYLIGGWEFDGQARLQTGQRFDFGGYRLVGMTEKDLQNMFKLRKEIDATDGKERYYMLPKAVIEQSIIALSTTSPTTVSGYAGASPTGQYLAPANGPDCVQYLGGMCPGTVYDGRVIRGPMYVKFDFSFVKRFQVWGRKTVEWRMDLYNVFDNINFIPVGVGGSTYRSWEITSAARDLNASQDAGGRITSFGLRFTW